MLVDEYTQFGKLEGRVEYSCDIQRLSSRYFNDLLNFKTGKTIEEYFQLKRIEVAKNMLLNKDSNVSEVAKRQSATRIRILIAR